MKNDLGIEVCCIECKNYHKDDFDIIRCDDFYESVCKKHSYKYFVPYYYSLVRRVIELQNELANLNNKPVEVFKEIKDV